MPALFDYVAAGGVFTAGELEEPEDSLTRELRLQDDAANELIVRTLHGEQEALDLWYKTRAWVISGHRKTLARLGIAFDRVLFESDFLPETAELAETGLHDQVLTRREDGVVIYNTGLEELEQLSLVRADGLPTQHMRSLAYCMTAPELDQVTSLQVTGTEWVSHLASVRKLAAELRPDSNSFHPSRTIFHGMVARQKRALASSEGALLIDDLLGSLDSQIDGDPKRREVRRAHPSPERVAAQVALGIRYSAMNVGRAEPAPADMEPMSWAIYSMIQKLGALQGMAATVQLQALVGGELDVGVIRGPVELAELDGQLELMMQFLGLSTPLAR